MKAIAYSITFVGALFVAATADGPGIVFAAMFYAGTSFALLVLSEAGK